MIFLALGAAVVAGTSHLEIVTLVVAIIGVALAVASLAWQAATFVLSGSRVGLTLRRGLIRRDGSGTVALALGPLEPNAGHYGVMREQGFTEEVVIVEVRNRGRMAVSVESVRADTQDGWGFARIADPENPTVPHRLEPGAKETWHEKLAAIQKIVDTKGESQEVWMTVELGTGKVLRTKQTTVVVPSNDG
jgi:hypothetical protein